MGSSGYSKTCLRRKSFGEPFLSVIEGFRFIEGTKKKEVCTVCIKACLYNFADYLASLKHWKHLPVLQGDALIRLDNFTGR